MVVAGLDRAVGFLLPSSLSLLPLSRTLSGLSGVGGVRAKHGAVLLLVYGVGIAPNGRGSVLWNRNRGGTTAH